MPMEELNQLKNQFKLEKDTATDSIAARNAELVAYLSYLDKVSQKIEALSQAYNKGVIATQEEHETEKAALLETRTIHKEVKDNHNKALVAMDADIESKSKAIDTLVDKKTTLDRDNTGLSLEKRALSEQVTGLLGQISTLNRQLTDARTESNTLTASIAAKKTEETELIASNDEKKANFIRLSNEVKILEDRKSK